jgi:hypothetical protein
MDGGVIRLAIANIALGVMYTPLRAVVMAKDRIGRNGKLMDAAIITASYAGISAFLFPVAASVLTVLTQDVRFLWLDIIPPIVLGGCATLIGILNG